MRVFIVVKDETDYNGDVTYPKVFTCEFAAHGYAASETEAAERWVASMREVGEQVENWIPNFYVVPSELDSKSS